MFNMKNKSTVAAIIMGLTINFYCSETKAGDPGRAGQAGASELLIDPWAGTSGFAEANTACVQGIEAQFLNVAGTAQLNQTQVILASTDYLAGSGIHISEAGFCQPVGEGTIGLSIMSMSLGTINMTSYDYPDGGIGYFTPELINMGISYARHFSDYIFGGVNIKLIDESISNVHAFGAAIDAGIQYVAGNEKNIHFGIALKNVGPAMNYSGDGLAFETPLPAGSNTTGADETAEQRSQAFELPSLVNIGAAYDFYLAKDSGSKSVHRLTVAANFTSNSFTQDQEAVGLEYAYKSFFSVEAGYNYQNGAFDNLSTNPTNGGRLTAFTGFCAGATLQCPFGKKHSIVGISYSYRATNPYQGCNTIGIKMNL
jgi:hypothetical protein